MRNCNQNNEIATVVLICMKYVAMLRRISNRSSLLYIAPVLHMTNATLLYELNAIHTEIKTLVLAMIILLVEVYR